MQSDQEFIRAYQRVLERLGREDRADCTSPEAILSLVEGTEEEDARLRTLDHVMACPPCREDFELLRALARSRPAELIEKNAARPSFRFRPQKLAWAASLVLALGAGSIWWGSMDTNPADVMRGDGDGVQLISPSTGAVLEGDMAFVWHPVPGAFRYDLEVFGPDGTVVFQESTPDTVLLARDFPFAPGSPELSWWVTASTADGARISSTIRPLGPESR